MGFVRGSNAFKPSTWQSHYLGILGVLGLVYLFINAQNQLAAGNVFNAVSLVVMAGTFLFLFITGLLADIIVEGGDLGKIVFPHLFDSASIWVDALTFLTGFVVFAFMTGGLFTIVGYNATQSIYSSAQGALSPFWQVFVIGVAAPIMEEIFFLVGGSALLFGLISFISQSDRSLKWLDNVWVRTILATGVVAYVFALYHTGQAGNWAFFYAALIFRAILFVSNALDSYNSKIIPLIDATFLFAVSAHMANNWNSLGGIPHVFSVLSTDIFGWAVILFFALNAYLVLIPFIRGKSLKSMVARA